MLNTVGQMKQAQSNNTLDHLHEDVRLAVTSIGIRVKVGGKQGTQALVTAVQNDYGITFSVLLLW